VRELRYEVSTPGFRVRVVTLVTTLLDPLIYPKSELALLYRKRWRIEVCQANHVSSDTLYRCSESTHSGCFGVVGAGPMEPRTPRSQARVLLMRRHLERQLPPRLWTIRVARSA
jgi:hypothetical protein